MGEADYNWEAADDSKSATCAAPGGCAPRAAAAGLETQARSNNLTAAAHRSSTRSQPAELVSS